MRVLLFIFIVFFAFAQTPTVVAQSDLRLNFGDISLDSGTIVRSPDVPKTAESFKKLLRQQFNKLIGLKSTLQLMQERAKKAASQDTWTTKLEVVKRRSDYALQQICDEYVGFYLQPRMRLLSPKLQKAVIEISDPKEGLSKKCEYGIKQRLALTTSDGAVFPRKAYKFFSLDFGAAGKVLTAFLTQSRRLDVAKNLVDVIIIVPIAASDTVKLSEYLTVAAKQLYSDKRNKYFTFRFQALTAGSAPGRYRFPGRSVMAFAGSNGQIVLVQEIKYRFSNLQGKDAKVGKTQVFVEVLALNSNLSKALAAGVGAPAGGPFKQYVSNAIYTDSRRILKIAGEYAAEVLDINRVVVVSKETFPGRRQGMRIPISYERKGGDWIVMNRRK